MEVSGFRSSLFSDLGMDEFVIMEQSEMNAAPWFSEIDFHPPRPAVLNFKRAAVESSEMEGGSALKQMKKATSSSSQPGASQSPEVNKRPCEREIVKRISTDIHLHQAREHSLAERKRREKLTHRILTLSTLVPGLKKMDKVSVLEDAIKYIKQLQDKMKSLEKQKNRMTAMESAVCAVKYYGDDGDHRSSSQGITGSFPEIEARFCNNELLINIHCEKRKGLLEKVASEVENLHYSLVNISAVTYGDSALNITLVAEKDEQQTSSAEELIKNLSGLLK